MQDSSYLNLDQLERALAYDPKFSNHFVEVMADSLVAVELVYASTNNFMNENMYHSFQRPWLHRQAYDKFIEAKRILSSRVTGYKFLIYDALRPWRFQVTMFARVKGTLHESYVANPDRGSLHNYGLAMDLTLLDSTGKPLDMGSEFDEFSEISQPQLEEELLKSNRLTKQQYQNRIFLREIMTLAGFEIIPNEWWHFNSCSLEEAKKIAPRVS